MQTKRSLFKCMQGGALLTALFIMTLVAIAATAMSLRIQLDIYRTQMLLTRDKLYFASQEVMFWAMGQLSQKDKFFTQINAEGIVVTMPESRVDNITVKGKLYDQQNRLNLNNFIEKQPITPLLRLFQLIKIQGSDQEKKDMALALQHWISTYDLSLGKDKFTSFYSTQKPPYNPSHQLMKSPSELRLVEFISAPLYNQLRPYITTLPEITPINLNTATAKILKTVGDGLNDTQIEEIINARGTQGINAKVLDELLKKFNIPVKQVSLESKYFLSEAQVQSNESTFNVYVLLKRVRDQKGNITVSVQHQSFETF